MFQERINKLGRAIAHSWTAGASPSEEFSLLAADLLRAAELHDVFSLSEFVQWTAGGDLPVQRGAANFGEPAVTLYVGDGFYIELYCWLRSGMSIHDHAFDGAFTTLQGASLEVCYDFQADETFGEVSAGVLSPSRVETIAPGDVQLIDAGARLVHQVWRLGRPTISLVVRTDQHARETAQRAYFLPGLAVPASHRIEGFAARIGMARFLAATANGDEPTLVRDFFSAQEPASAFYAWLAINQDAPPEWRERVRQDWNEAFGVLGGAMMQAAEQARTARFFEQAPFTSANERFLAAVLLSGLERTQILSLLRARCGDGSVRAKATAWLDGIITALGGSVTENDFCRDIFGLAADGLSYDEIFTQIAAIYDMSGETAFNTMYNEVAASPLLERILPPVQ